MGRRLPQPRVITMDQAILSNSCTVLALYDSQSPQIEPLASAICEGVSTIRGVRPTKVRIRKASRQDLLEANAIALGTPNWSGMTGALKMWLDDQGDLWEEGCWRARLAPPLPPDGDAIRVWNSPSWA